MIESNVHLYINALFVLMITSILAYLSVINKLRNENYPASAVSYFNLYFILGIVGWISLWVMDYGLVAVNYKVLLVFYVLDSLLLFMAVAECDKRKQSQRKVVILHALLLVSSLFFHWDMDIILIIAGYNILVYPLIFYFSYRRAKRNGNIGNGIIALAALLVVVLVPLQLFIILYGGDFIFAYNVTFIASSTGFELVGIGFLTTMLINQHNKLTELTLKDPLTGLLNRRGLDQALQLSLSQIYRKNDCVSAILLDIDHFKKINDTYGHDCGDYVLQVFANKLMLDARESDAFCRLGGEEFVIVLPGTASIDAEHLAERLRLSIVDMVIPYAGKEVRLTSSFGVATHCGRVDIDDLLKDADKALYRAKSEGRNRVCLAVI